MNISSDNLSQRYADTKNKRLLSIKFSELHYIVQESVYQSTPKGKRLKNIDFMTFPSRCLEGCVFRLIFE